MDYNTKEGIGSQLGSYDALYAIMKLRNEQMPYKSDGSRNGQRTILEPFTVLGRYRSDQFGQCGRLNREIFTDDDRKAMPQVMTDNEFQVFFDEHVKVRIKKPFYSMYEGVTGAASAFPLPSPHLVCAKCGETWQLETCHDIDSEGKFEGFDLALFVGKTLREVESELQKRTDGERSFGHPLAIHNPRWTTADPDDEFATSEERGWRRGERDTENLITSDYVVKPGDSTTIFCYHFYHGSCFRMMKQECAIREDIENINGMKKVFEEVGFEDVRITRMPFPDHLRTWAAKDLNEGESVDNAAEGSPYYAVQTQQGSFGIWNAAYPVIDLHDSGVALHDFVPELATEIPIDFPPFVGITGEPEQFMRLLILMMKQKARD